MGMLSPSLFLSAPSSPSFFRENARSPRAIATKLKVKDNRGKGKGWLVRALGLGSELSECDGEAPICSSSSGLTLERGVVFSTGPSFYRAQSSLGRDLAVLAAALYKRSQGQLRVLDAMSGCGVRALRYLAQSQADFVVANDCNPGLHTTIVENLSRYAPHQGVHYPSEHAFGPAANPYSCSEANISSTGNPKSTLSTTVSSTRNPNPTITNAGNPGLSCGPAETLSDVEAGPSQIGIKWQVSHEEATRLLMRCHLNMDFFDLIDVDSFGSDSLFIGAALSAIRFDGLLYLTCTDGFSSGGHRPHNSLASYGAFIKPMPYANEMGLRMLIGAVVKEAALRKMVVSPVFSVYAAHGPVFRVLLRASAGKPSKIKHYRFIYYCGKCGDSNAIDWESLGTTSCPCSDKVSDSIKMSGPLWTGPLHNSKDIQEMMTLAKEWGWIPNVTEDESVCRSSRGRRMKLKQEKLLELLNLMLEESNPDLPFGYIYLDEIAKRGKIQTPRREALVQALRNEGYVVGRSQIAPNAVKTNCSMTCCIALAQRLTNIGH